MCGIVGWLDWERNLEEEVSMLDKMMKPLPQGGLMGKAAIAPAMFYWGTGV